MGNSQSTQEETVMKKSFSPSRTSPTSPVNTPLNSALNPEAPPNYDELFGPPGGSAARPASTSRSNDLPDARQNGSQRGPAPPIPNTAYQIPPPSQAAWGSTPITTAHPQYSAPAPNWRQQEEEQELRMWFGAVDENGDGFITAEELRQALLNDNWTPFNIDTIKMMLKMFDRNMNDRIEFDEFAGLKRYVQEWKKTFDVYDVDHSGTIDVQEIQQAFKGMNYTFTMEFCGMLCRRFSNRAAGQINLDAFIYACAMVNAMSKDHARLSHPGSLEEYLRNWLNKPSL